MSWSCTALPSIVHRRLAGSGGREAVSRSLPVAPAEAGQFAASQPGRRCEIDRGLQPQVCGGVQVGPELFSGPGFRSFARLGLRAWWPGFQRDVRGHVVAAFRITKAGSQNDVDVVDGLRGKWSTEPVAARKKVEVKPVEVFGTQPTDRHVAEGRFDVVVDDPAVPPERCRSELRFAEREPLLGEVPAERDRCGLFGDLNGVLFVEGPAIASASARHRPAGCLRRRSLPVSGSVPSYATT